jgi:hypothetical protein
MRVTDSAGRQKILFGRTVKTIIQEKREHVSAASPQAPIRGGAARRPMKSYRLADW